MIIFAKWSHRIPYCDLPERRTIIYTVVTNNGNHGDL